MGLRLLWILAIITVTATDNQCPRKCFCDRSIGGDSEVICNRNGSQILRVVVKYGTFLKVDCSNQNAKSNDYELLEGLTVGPVQKVEFQFCPATEFMTKLSEKVNVTSAKTLKVEQTNFTNTLQKRFFNKFSTITKLDMHNSGITQLPDDFFEDLGNLSSLNLRDNELTSIPVGLFRSVPKLSFLELGANKINYLRPGVFQDLRQLKYLNLWGNSLHNITEKEVFSGLTGLSSLDFHNSGLTLLTSDVLTHLNNLKEISLLKNNFSSLPIGLLTHTQLLETFKLFDNYQRLVLPSGLLANLTNLKSVLLYSNNMTNVPEDLFRGSSSIQNIQLQGNAFTMLPDSLFKDTIELQILDISFNQLETLSAKVFSSLTKLQKLNLANNHLTTISEATFKSLTKLEVLNLQRNRLTYIHPKAFPSSDTESCQIKQLYLAHNQLAFKGDENFSVTDIFGSQSTLNFCTKLKELYLGNNNLTEIFNDWKHVMLHLEKLDLSNNHITQLQSADLQFLSNKLEVNLSNNNISVFVMTSIEIISQEFKSDKVDRNVRVNLKGNPIKCDCQAYNLLKYIERKFNKIVYNYVNILTDDLRCTSPPEVSGALVSQLKSETVTCDLTNKNVTCPKPCSCRGRTDDRAFIVDCSQLDLLRAPEKLPTGNIWNYTELHIDGNRLRTLPDLSQEGYEKVMKIFASHNNISQLVEENVSPKIKVLELHMNNLTHVPKGVVDFLLKNDTHLERITLDNNPWQCDCEDRDLLHYIKVFFRKVENLSTITCSNGKFLSQLSADDLCPVSNELMIALSTSVAAIGIMLGALAALYYRYQREVKVWLYAKNLCLWFVTEEELDKDKLYDAFISYSHKDEDFVVNHLVPELENGPAPFKLCLHFRDWVAGEWITSQIARSVEDSRRTVVVLSPNFLDSVWGRMEFRAAHKQALSEGRARLILLIYGELGPLDSLDPELKAYLSTNTYVKWGDPWFWNKLRYALPHSYGTVNKTDVISMPPSHHCNGAYEEEHDLMQSTTPSATTPPADSIVDPMTRTNTPLSILNSQTKLILETSNHVNGCVKSV